MEDAADAAADAVEDAAADAADNLARIILHMFNNFFTIYIWQRNQTEEERVRVEDTEDVEHVAAKEEADVLKMTIPQLTLHQQV